jgi:hypothetical protein
MAHGYHSALGMEIVLLALAIAGGFVGLLIVLHAIYGLFRLPH